IFLVILMLVPLAAFAKGENERIAHASGGGAAIEWVPNIEHESLVMTVALPDGSVLTRHFQAGSNPLFRIQDIPGRVADGVYSYELRVVPRVSAAVRESLAEARERGDDAA